ncbi:hypothetical protein SASPL_111883 [Salvia splendens]|uniref:Uncharacterized protein n=1 Tax=Salvia splendens TaxID=180675 RepID=A0A8X9A2S7_SALSN|nr:hypothetical protein SASPL_111883 [Salvia splendens]
MDIPPQDLFFFKGKWSVELDDQLIATLVGMKEELREEWPSIPNEVLVVASMKVDAVSSIKLSIEELKDRVQFLATRYETFHAVVSTPGVLWYPNLKVVDAVDSVWVQLMKESSSELKVDVPKEIIVLSDTTIPCRDVIDLTSCDYPFSEEVNSPATMLGEKMRRKLFHDDAESSDRESSNKPPAIHYVPGPQGKPMMKTTLARRMPLNFHVPVPKLSPGGSSEASNSPNPRGDIHRS